jgi:hypothetical protein
LRLTWAIEQDLSERRRKEEGERGEGEEIEKKSIW